MEGEGHRGGAVAPVIGDGDSDCLPHALWSAVCPVLPALVPGDEGGAGDAGRGEWHAGNDEKKGTPTAAHIGA